ncbi:protein-L-isoaspartate(D-aspartate) O-methyltransferase [Thalassotalea sp. PS06]|uniref:protein-L-isoaspartate(D-aspartate) O-methyltransferase n=1 Tax=Thalassotalea sp. PS06 TaxID=2594005 RepID=UPI0011655BFD|nr:protein-L-isoaspartate(D-aspartate) O-methyltransferase [Thalassotalea sp. PS06]QDP01996.1 protein-L-isoaspartate(D-aspartate) O-methyltransferase [Thalassotalea sp. PS06]
MSRSSSLGGKSQRSGLILAKQLQASGITSTKVLEAIANCPRHLFVPEILAHKAYDNTALPIGQGQTISQPYIVARMTELILSDNNDQVLEVGTGSGYQTAILAQIFAKVFSVERIKSLQWQAKRRLRNLDLHNVSMKHGDGWKGWANKGPYKAIIVTAAPDDVPPQLLEQLDDGGKMIIPVGQDHQILRLITRNNNNFQQQMIEAVRFVPLVPGELL